MNRKNLSTVLAIAVMLKIAYLALGSYLGGEDAVEIFKRHDGYWYEKIAVGGHHVITPDELGKCDGTTIEQSYYAFFPLYPLLCNGIMRITGWSFNFSAFGLSSVVSLLMFLCFYRFIFIISKSNEVAFWSTIVLIFFPFGFYFSMFYTEGLFVLLLILSMILVLQKEWVLFYLTSGLMVLTRPNGFVTLLVLMVFIVEFSEGSHFSVNGLRSFLKENVRKLNVANMRTALHLIPAVCFFVGYCTYLYFMTGDFFAFKTAQRGWCKEITVPLTPFGNIDTQKEVFYTAYLFLFTGAGIWGFKRLPISLSFHSCITLGLPLLLNSITLPRFISTAIGFPFLFGHLLARKSVVWKAGVFALLLLLHFATFLLWIWNSEYSY